MCSSSSVAAKTSQDFSILSTSGALKAADSCGVQLGCRSGNEKKHSSPLQGRLPEVHSSAADQIDPHVALFFFAIKSASPHLPCDHIICITHTRSRYGPHWASLTQKEVDCRSVRLWKSHTFTPYFFLFCSSEKNNNHCTRKHVSLVSPIAVYQMCMRESERERDRYRLP